MATGQTGSVSTNAPIYVGFSSSPYLPPNSSVQVATTGFYRSIEFMPPPQFSPITVTSDATDPDAILYKA